MERLKGTIDRFEDDQAVIRVDGRDVIIPQRYLNDFREGEVVSIIIANEDEDTAAALKESKSLTDSLFK